jgi:hypothetical protein
MYFCRGVSEYWALFFLYTISGMYVLDDWMAG